MVLVGESNPYGADPHYALYPAPDGSAGQRLCQVILGLSRKRYLECFDRVNLCRAQWRIREAREAAGRLIHARRRVVALGSKVCSAFGIPFEPFSLHDDGRILCLPHPSGLCRLWNEPGCVDSAREATYKFCGWEVKVDNGNLGGRDGKPR